MVQQPWRRSYYHFLSFASHKRRVRAAGPPRLRLRKLRAKKAFSPRPEWDSTIHDLSALKLSEAQIKAKTKAYKSNSHYRVTRPVVPKTPTTLSRRCIDAEDSELGGVHINKRNSITTIDFEDEVKQFEADRKKVQKLIFEPVVRQRLRTGQRSNRTATIPKNKCKRIKGHLNVILRPALKNSVGAMNRSSPTRYTHHPSLQVGGIIDSSDDSVSGPLENMRRQKGLQSTAKHRRSHKRLPDAEGPHHAENVESVSWEPRRRELVQFKGDPNVNLLDTKMQTSGRTKMVKRHYASVQRTSPIGDWNGDLEEDSDEHFSRHKDFQHYLVKCNHDLIKELKELKLCFSRQIMNLQLDVDKILANQQQKEFFPPKGGSKGHSSHRSRPAAEADVEKLVGADIGKPMYSSLKAKQEFIRPASPSSGESYHLPSSQLGSQYTESRKMVHFGSRPKDESRHLTSSSKLLGAPTDNHVFRNLQNNPIYHVQTSSEKRGGSSDSDTSISSVEQNSKTQHEGPGGVHDLLPESDGKDPCSSEDLNINGEFSRSSPGCLPDFKQNTGGGSSCTGTMVAYESVPDLGTAARNQIQHVSFKDSRPQSNGYVTSSNDRPGSLEDHNQRVNDEATLGRMLQFGPSKSFQKDDVRMSNLLGSSMAKSKGTKDDANGLLHPAIPAANIVSIPGRASPHQVEYKSRSSLPMPRPLICEEAVQTSWGNISPTSASLTYTRVEAQIQQCVKPETDLGWQRSQNSMIEAEGQPFTLRGWAAAFLQPQTERKSQEPTVQTVLQKTAAPSFVHDSQKREESVVQESPKKEHHREKENGSQYIVRQFAGKSSKGGCAWTVSEPASSPKSSPKDGSANSTPTSKGRSKHHYSVTNH